MRNPCRDVFDFLERVDMHSINRKNLESLVKSGAFDGVGNMHRAQYFVKEGDIETAPIYIERLMRWASRKQETKESAQMSIFDMSEDIKQEEYPQPPTCPEWTAVERCRFEKDVISIYLSGHPLDDYDYEMNHFVNTPLEQLVDLAPLKDKDLSIGGIVSYAKTGISQKNGDPFGILKLDDYSGSFEIRLYKDEYAKYSSYFTEGNFLFIRATVQQWPARPLPDGSFKISPPKFKVLSMMSLGSVLDKFTHQLSFRVPLSAIDASFCHRLKEAVNMAPGSVPMIANVYDPNDNLSLLMKSPGVKISPREIIPILKRSLPEISDIRPLTIR